MSLPEITITLSNPQLTEALRSLAKAQLAAAEAFERVASILSSESAQGGMQYSGVMTDKQQPALPSAVHTALPAENSGQMAPTQPAPVAYTYPMNPIAASMPSTPALPGGKAKTPEVSLEDLIRAVASLMGVGKYLPVVELLGRFGVQALHQLPRESFGPFADALRGLGARI